ncbi:ABC transporter substrate-binding protein [Catellatospora citrea]|uniref:ABC transporter substrate-binding protein n=1 Tax=Catellatospora citrea TaxID=53366 RepID=A0A8J3NYF5_9ACTN|nr:iron-siderophore ABC transporter substrate-binding protein [Catellatospora citrea]RKE09460.1 iron complex transport system substrate-binding protein [Catellatospora citrea]GIF97420.1 ABC transporter substrate-binding protein [Catellatospora citrea]
MKKRLVLVAVVAAGLALAGCGTAKENTGDGAATVEVTHAMGTTKVPAAPKRVVVLDTDKVDTALTLGVKPVGAARAGELTGWPTYFGAGATDGITEVGVLDEPDLEGIAALKPDLILGSKFRQEKYYAELSKIAPTVFTENVGKTWKANFLLDGKALGKEQQAKDLLAAYEKRAKEVGAAVPDAATLKISLVRFMPDHIRIYGPESFSGIVLGDAGLARPERQLLAAKDDKRFDKVSAERLTEVDGDFIFVAAYGEKSAAEQAKITAGPLWATLGAVKAGKTQVVADETWMTGIGVTAANKILDDLATYLK